MSQTTFFQRVFTVIAVLFCFFTTNAQTLTPNANGIIYVKPNNSGNGTGTNWENATNDLHNAIQAAGVQKVFVAKGNYNVGSTSFIMKNGVAIYGGFDPGAGITDLTHNRIMPNAANTNGSILNGEGTRPVIWNVFNSATAMNNTAVLDGFTVINGSYSNGAGIRNVYASPTLRNLVVRGNTGTATGAGIYNENSNPDIYNTVISNNMIIAPFNQSGMGAGIYNGTNSAPTIVNTTIANNTITGIGANPIMVGAGVASLGGANPKIYNSIIWNNQKNGVANTAGADIENVSATLTLKNSITQSFTTGNTGDNNKVGSNPLFVGAADYRLQGISPALNAGSNALFPGLDANTKDLAGNSRLGGLAIDMGAYEYTLLPDNNGIVYVRQGFTGSGKSWVDATGDLHNAIHATGVTKVFVAVGNYNVGDHSFIMKNNVEIYGGFDPVNGITDLSHNRIMPNAANTNGSVLNGQGVRPVVWNEYSEQNQLYGTAILDGFTIMNGRNDELKGAGIYNFGASPTLRNLILRNNVMTSLGAALYNVGSSAIVTNVSIVNNQGRGVVNSQSTPQFTNVLISGNTDVGVYNWGNTYVHVGTYTNVTIASNGLPFQAGAYSHFKNSILWDDINGYDYGGENNLIKGNVSTANGNLNATEIEYADIFKDPSNGDYTLKFGSPAINVGDNTLFTGLNADTKDLAGNPRLSGASIDLGAYESISLTPANGIIYVKENGTGDGSSWTNATSDLHNAIQAAGVQKVFVAVGNYNVGEHSFIMKNNVEIYGGFDPENGIEDLDDERILPNHLLSFGGGGGGSEGSVLNGQNARPVIWNVFTSGTALNTTAILDGFTVMNGDGGNSYGGGINNYYASPTLINLVVKNNINTTPNSSIGGGIKNENSSPVITNTIIKGNTATIGSAMANVNNCNPVLTNVLITGNTATHPTDNFKETVHTNNSGIYTNVTIAGNNGKPLQGSGGTAQYSNVIAVGNTGTFSSSHVNNSIISGNTNLTNGNIDASSLTDADIFTDPANGVYTLKEGSPAVNAGNNTLFTDLDENTLDLVGNPRVYDYANDGVIDLGAYESSFVTITPDADGIIYVKETQSGTGSGKDWDNATSDLHNAIQAAGVQKVFVAVGNYNVGNSSFTMKNNVEIYGGFDPENGIEDLSDNRILPTLTQEGSVLDGEDSRTVIRNEFTVDNPLGNTAVLDGFTLTGGNGYIEDYFGGGIYNYYASPVLNNLVIRNGDANRGGGMYNEYSNPIVSNTILHNNEAHMGGGVYNFASSPVFTNITLSENSATDGGAIFTMEYSVLKFTNARITGNTGYSSSVVYNIDSDLSFINAEITNNQTLENFSLSGDILNFSEQNVLFQNSTFAYNNNARRFVNAPYGGNIFLKNAIVFDAINQSGHFIAESSFISNNEDDSNGNIVLEDIYEDNIFTDPDNGDFTLKVNSPVINRGNNALYPGLDENTLDLAGNPRLFGSVIDLGAYESTFMPASEHCLYTTIWNGSSWSNGEPDDDTQAIIDGDLVLDYDLGACEVVVTANGSLRILDDSFLYVEWSVTNLATADDFVIENNGALIQWKNVENTGAVTILRDSQPMKRLDYTLWSSPVVGQNLFEFSPGTVNGVTNFPGSTGRIYIYDGENGYVNPNPFTVETMMNPAVGYLFRAPNNFHATDLVPYSGLFSGVPNNGNIEIPVVPGSYTSIGNPYPSNISARDFLIANQGIESLYFWNNTGVAGSNYAIFTILGGTPAGGGSATPTDYISVGQGFIVESATANSVNFDNMLRVTNSANFFRIDDETERHRFWLSLSDEFTNYNNILTGYMSGATNAIDQQIDGKEFGYDGTAIYHLIAEEHFAIQGRALPFDSSDVVPLGFRAEAAGRFTISLTGFDGLFAEGITIIYLKDKDLGLIHNLMESDYTFESVAGEFNARFEILYKIDEGMGTEDVLANSVLIYTQEHHIFVYSQSEKILSVELFDLTGRKIHANTNVNSNLYRIGFPPEGVMIVKVLTYDGKIKTKKIINN